MEWEKGSFLKDGMLKKRIEYVSSLQCGLLLDKVSIEVGTKYFCLI